MSRDHLFVQKVKFCSFLKYTVISGNVWRHMFTALYKKEKAINIFIKWKSNIDTQFLYISLLCTRTLLIGPVNGMCAPSANILRVTITVDICKVRWHDTVLFYLNRSHNDKSGQCSIWLTTALWNSSSRKRSVCSLMIKEKSHMPQASLNLQGHFCATMVSNTVKAGCPRFSSCPRHAVLLLCEASVYRGGCLAVI